MADWCSGLLRDPVYSRCQLPVPAGPCLQWISQPRLVPVYGPHRRTNWGCRHSVKWTKITYFGNYCYRISLAMEIQQFQSPGKMSQKYTSFINHQFRYGSRIWFTFGWIFHWSMSTSVAELAPFLYYSRSSEQKDISEDFLHKNIQYSFENEREFNRFVLVFVNFHQRAWVTNMQLPTRRNLTDSSFWFLGHDKISLQA